MDFQHQKSLAAAVLLYLFVDKKGENAVFGCTPSFKHKENMENFTN